MASDRLSQLLLSLGGLAYPAEVLTFEFVAKFDADGQRAIPKSLILERNEQNSVPEVPDLIFNTAIMGEWCDEDLPVEHTRSAISAVGSHLDSIFDALELSKKITVQGRYSNEHDNSVECGGHLVAVLKKDTSTTGVLHEGSWEMSHMIDWDGGFRGFIASVFTLEQVRNRNSVSGSEFRVLVEEG